MAVRTDLSDRSCTMARGADVLADPWVVLVLRELFQQHGRFDDIVARTGAAESVVSRRLALLLERGLIAKVPYRAPSRQQMEYRLTESGRDTLPVLHALSQWSAKHTADHGRVQIECLRCGTEPSSADWCARCALPLTSATTGWRKPSTPETLTMLVGEPAE